MASVGGGSMWAVAYPDLRCSGTNTDRVERQVR